MANAVVPLRGRLLDRPITFTHFPNLAGDIKRERTLSRFRELEQLIEQTQAKAKARLPLLSFARYGNLRTDKRSLKHDHNVLSIGAISGDHDAGTQTLEEAEKLLADAGIAAVLHTTASHTPDAPRWHVFCRLSGELPPEPYKSLAARLNGVLGGTLKSESFNLSQGYYYGHVQGSTYQIAVVDGLRTIDEATELDAGAIYPARAPDDSRSGDAARLVYQIKVVNRGTFSDFCNAVDDDPELWQWRYENRRKQGSDRQMGRAWSLVKAPPNYDDVFDIWAESPQQTIRATPFTWIEPALIPPRRWLYSTHLIRGFPSSTVATGGRGKTTLLVTEALAMATGRALLGDQPAGKLRVWIISTEDPKEELQRRIAAACIHYGITESDIGGRLFLNAGHEASTVVATETREGIKIVTPMVDTIRAEILTNRVDALLIDPFVDSHEVNENDNTRIAAVIRIWARIADETDSAIELSHHSRKPAGGDQILTVDDARGATSIIYKVRDARIMNTMTRKDADIAGITNPRFYFNITSGKANLAPPPDKVIWRKFTGERLGNGTDDLDPGDDIGVIEPWEWPDLIGEITDDQKREILLHISKLRYGAAPQAKDWVGKMVAEVLGVDIKNASDRALVSKLLADLRKTHAIKHVDGQDQHRKPKVFVEVDQWLKNYPQLDGDDL